MAAPGTQALIQLLPRLFPGRRVAVLGPTYNEHAASWRQGGAVVDEVTDLAALRGADVAVVVNPNNPDGQRHAPEDLLALGARVLIVDEAFADLEPAPLSLAAMLPRPGVVVLRSFGKTYGLAGLRLGFAMAEERAVAAVRRMLGPWAVGGPTITVGEAALADEAWRSTMRERLRRDVGRLDDLLTGSGCRVLGGTLLFRLAQSDAPLAERLGEAGILVRAFPFAPTWFRFGVPGDEGAWARLASALAS